jgi:hypothetical protein
VGDWTYSVFYLSGGYMNRYIWENILNCTLRLLNFLCVICNLIKYIKRKGKEEFMFTNW